MNVPLGGSGVGALGMRAPLGAPNSFIFMQFSAKNRLATHFGSWRPLQENPASASGSKIFYDLLHLNYMKPYSL